jgi:hypothetical protein
MRSLVPEPPSFGLAALPAGRRPGTRRGGKAGSGRSVASPPVRSRLALVAGGVAVATAAAYRLVRGRPAPSSQPEPIRDDRAEALRQKLAESRDVVRERDEFEGAETPIDAVEDVQDVEERRRAVHERGRHAVDRMRREDS